MAERLPAEFNVGDHVRVVPSERHSTRRGGVVRQVVWHFKEGCYNYYITEDGKKVSTRYLAIDLERVPPEPAGS